MIGNRKIIALCLSKIQNEVCGQYVAALNSVAVAEGYGLFVYNTCSSLNEENCFADAGFYVYGLIDFDIVDVLIVYEESMHNSAASDYLIQQGKEHGVPVIVIGESHEGCVNIRFDHEHGFSEIVCHMLEEHHMTRLHFMAGLKGNPFSEYRLGLFKEVMMEHGIPFDDSMVSYGDFWSGPAEREMEKLIASGNLPEAVICANDKMAIAVCGVLNKHGIRIPEDVAVTGFDGIPEINFSSPRITSSSCCAADLAEKTREILASLDSFRNRTESFLVRPRLCVAESCGCKEKKPVDASQYLNAVNDHFYLFQEENLTLSELTAKIQRCDTIGQVVEEMHRGIFYDMCCVVEKSCLEETVNPVQYCKEGFYRMDREMILLFDSNHTENFHPYPFYLKKVVPGLEYCLESNRPLIFTALQYMGIPMGYVCFFFSYLNPGICSSIAPRIHALNNAIGGYRNMRYKNYLVRQIEEMYRTDTLTGLYNRRGFALEYQKLLDSQWRNSRLTIILADLDHLKYINDTFGHKEGDFAIHAVAQALVHVCPEGSLFTRFGGDEMLAVCQGWLEPEIIRKCSKTRRIPYLSSFCYTGCIKKYTEGGLYLWKYQNRNSGSHALQNGKPAA
ncbi:MAG: GGDEF domain-containing protein, partial [Lachnospiraceae bacterium]|nr:GGDEF domain-containing protein [Lachnospiraceae bacterium]